MRSRVAALLIVCLVSAGLTLAGDEKKASKPKPINLDKLNTARDEDDPHVSSSGLFLYYSQKNKGKVDIMVTRRPSINAAWPPGKVIEDYISTAVDDRSTFLTKDGIYPQYLFFATKKDKEIDNFDIYVAVKQGATRGFSAPTPVNTVCTADDELYPWLSADGKQLYFSRKTKEGWRVLVASRASATGAAGFGAPKLLAELEPGFHHATLTPDGKTMYLQGPLANNRWGLFRSAWSGTAWNKPEPLDDLNNEEAPSGDRSPCLSRDGSMLYFTSDRLGGKGGLDIWRVPTGQLGKRVAP
jgi:hypothetical protein